MKIRIGNDIGVTIRLAHKFDEYNVSIISAVAYFVNRTKEAEAKSQCDKKTRFINRFPVEPYSEAYSSNAYDIMSNGCPYHSRYKYVYPGFGVTPDWKYVYGVQGQDCFDNCTRYRSEVKYTSDRAIVKIFFPADKQLFTGDYDIVLVSKIYCPGYYNNDARTVTIDCKSVFTLVDSSELGIDGIIDLYYDQQCGEASTTPFPQDEEVHAKSIKITGKLEVLQNEVFELCASVLPNTAVDRSVSWAISQEDEEYASIIETTPTTCVIRTKDGFDSGHNITILATSNDDESVVGHLVISIDDKTVTPGIDTYVYSGKYDGDPSLGGNVKLRLTNGLQVNVDLSKATGWYEDQ